MRRRIASMGAGGALLTAAMLGAVSLSATAVQAQEKKSAIPGTFSANVALTSEYYFRGLSQTDDAPALQGGIDYEVSLAEPVSLYAGVWGSNVDFNEGGGVDGATVEMDWYGGARGAIGATGLSWDVGFIYYSYPGADGDLDYDFVEVQGALGYDFSVAAVTASVNYSPDNFGGSGNAWYPKLALDVPVPGVEGLSFSGYVAKQYIEKNDVFGTEDYVEWNLSVGYSVAGFDLSLAYSDTDVAGNVDGKGEAILFTVARSF